MIHDPKPSDFRLKSHPYSQRNISAGLLIGLIAVAVNSSADESDRHYRIPPQDGEKTKHFADASSPTINLKRAVKTCKKMLTD